MEGNKTGNEKFVIFIGSDDGYDRIAKPLTGFASIEFKEARERIKAELGEIAPLKNTPFEIICDEEGQLLGKPVTMHNGYQHLAGDVIVIKFDYEKDTYNGLSVQEVKKLCQTLEANWKNDIQLAPLRDLVKNRENKTQEDNKLLGEPEYEREM